LLFLLRRGSVFSSPGVHAWGTDKTGFDLASFRTFIDEGETRCPLLILTDEKKHHPIELDGKIRMP